MKINVISVLRTIGTILLLAVVWKHNHWTVALVATLLTVNQLGILELLRQERRHRIARQKAEHNLFRKIKKLKESIKK